MYEAMTYSYQEKCAEKQLNYQPIWFTYSVVINNYFLVTSQVELETKLREVFQSFTITEKAPTRAFSWLKATALETDIIPCIVSEAEAFIRSNV